MKAVAVRNLREHKGELESAGNVALADKLVLQAELSVAAGARLAGMPYARYLQHLGALGYSMLDESTDLVAELALLQTHPRNDPQKP